jgi:IS30 family transposase
MFVYNEVEYLTQTAALEARRDHYFELLLVGNNSTQAARFVGVSKRTAKVWRNGRSRSSGRNEGASVKFYNLAMNTTHEIHSRYLSQEERIKIADGLIHEKSIRDIAKALGRSPSTISREIDRNFDSKTERYNPYAAEMLAQKRLARPKIPKVIAMPRLMKYIKDRLKDQWSPEQISNRLKVDYPDDKAMRISTETIYQAIYIQAKGQLKLEVQRALRSGKVHRKSRGDGRTKRSRFREPMVMISERPPEVEDRAVPGHWEGDLITGAKNQSAIGTLVERTTSYLALCHLPDDHSALSVQQAVIDEVRDMPDELRKSLTWDQGAELALHKQITIATNLDVYFCDPHSPWQRGSNENTNGLLRQYFPKGTDLSVHSKAELVRVARLMNNRPRKKLGWYTPIEAMNYVIEHGSIEGMIAA